MKCIESIPEDIYSFLNEYRKLCRKYGFYIDACGCCGSPWVEVALTDDEIERHIEHLKKQARLQYRLLCKPERTRGYQGRESMVDKSRKDDIEKAIELLKKVTK